MHKVSDYVTCSELQTADNISNTTSTTTTQIAAEAEHPSNNTEITISTAQRTNTIKSDLNEVPKACT